MIRTRPALDQIPQYVAGRSADVVAAQHAIGDVIKLASNEAPFPPLPAALEAMARAAATANRYPDDGAVALREAIAEHCEVEADHVLIGNGSVELCRMALAATCDAGDEVVFGRPSFEAYPILAQQVAATMVQVPLHHHRYDLAAMGDAVTARTRLVFVCNPNNPTGTVVTGDDVDRLLERVPRDCLVVFDEAYREFVTAPAFPDGVDLLRDHDNVAVLRTFSKAYGLASLRVGYAIARPDVIGTLRKVRVPFGVNGVAQAGALASLAADGEMRERVGHVVAERERLLAALEDLGVPVVPSEANFLWLDLPDDAAVLGEYAERAGVVLRPFPNVGVRVTVGTAEENDRFVRVLGAAIEDGAVGD